MSATRAGGARGHRLRRIGFKLSQNGVPPTKCFSLSELKSLIRRINSSVDSAIFRFRRFGLKLANYSRLFGEFSRYIFPIWRQPLL